jgi:Protein of unknwon function (DUF3008)
MPAESKKQQRFFGLVKSIQEGKATGSGKAQEAADSMSEESVRDFARTSHEDLPESKKESMDPNTEDLLKTMAISSGVGLGGVGVYGLLKYLSDNSLIGQGDRVKAMQRRLAIPQRRKFKEKLDEPDPTPVDPSDMLSDSDAGALSELPQELADDMRNPDKQASTLSEYLGEPFLYGMAKPVAMVAPAVMTYVLGKRLVDQYRKSKMDKDLNQAKKEFEAALSKNSSSEIQDGIDELFRSVKSADITDSSEPLQPAKVTPAHADPYGPGIGFQGLAYSLGLAPGVGALLGWMYMNNKMKDDPEKRKLKELNSLLKRDILSGALSSGIDIEQAEEGKPKFRL